MYVVKKLVYSPFDMRQNKRHIISDTKLAWFNDVNYALDYKDFKNKELPPVGKWRADCSYIHYVMCEEDIT